ncbi:septum formation protein Maf [Candidatus Peregrinibacteria bacterium CG10_big_fil_rev_8_21_14_0_10_42_8]|nr:MAG: septum formation protein Maf [Candidatus Peregrinibacteria bacterium CG10_big_fil_rev_8_21_14_0_10_42_8]
MSQHLVLASASPQRKWLLEGLGLTFDVYPSDFDEEACDIQDPIQRAKYLAYHKAETVNAHFPDSFVIGCDTLVVSESGLLLEKAPDAATARLAIQALSGKTAEVHSALSIVDQLQKHYDGVSSSRVTFKKFSREEIDWWIGTELWRDRSGSFQIDGPGQLMISAIEGDWSSVVGLPVYLLGELFLKVGYDWMV